MFRSIVVGSVLAAAAPAASAGEAQPHRLEVRLQNYAGLPAGVLRQAIVTAERSFRRTGVRIEWIDCTPDAGADARCRRDLTERTRVLRILSRKMMPRAEPSAVELGRAILRPNGTRGVFADVYWPRVVRLAGGAARSVSLRRDETSRPLKQSRILGYALAHELGHLLGLPHSPSGVMHGPWNPSELSDALAGTLRFRKEEEGFLRGMLSGQSNTQSRAP